MTQDPTKSPAMSERELLPCPFCGGPAGMIEGHRDHWRVSCIDCQATRSHWYAPASDVDPRETAAGRWNARLAPAPEKVVREEGEALARRFHDLYEKLAPSFGYETRTETRDFDPSTPNGKLMIAVRAALATQPAAGSEG